MGRVCLDCFAYTWGNVMPINLKVKRLIFSRDNTLIPYELQKKLGPYFIERALQQGKFVYKELWREQLENYTKATFEDVWGKQ